MTELLIALTTLVLVATNFLGFRYSLKLEKRIKALEEKK